MNDEIVATIVATMRESGLDAQPGNEDALTLSDNALIVTGRLRPTTLSDLAKGKPVVFGTRPSRQCERRYDGVVFLRSREETAH